MKIADVMTPEPACCEVSDNVQVAAVIMKELNVGIIPIVENDETKRLVGVVTDRDLCVKVLAEGKDPGVTIVKDCMTSQLFSCHPDDDVAEVLHEMQENQVRRIPVIDSDNRVRGIVSTADMVLCGALATKDIGQAMKDISEPTLEEFKHLSQLTQVNSHVKGDNIAIVAPPEGSSEHPTI